MAYSELFLALFLCILPSLTATCRVSNFPAHLSGRRAVFVFLPPSTVVVLSDLHFCGWREREGWRGEGEEGGVTDLHTTMLYPICIDGGPCNTVCLFLRTVRGDETRKIYEWLRRLLLRLRLRLSLFTSPSAFGLDWGVWFELGRKGKDAACLISHVYCAAVWLLFCMHMMVWARYGRNDRRPQQGNGRLGEGLGRL